MRANVHVPTYRSWQMMKNRCLNSKATDFKYYGGRGITIDPAWMKYDAFIAAMGERPEGTTLERKDGALGYTRSNCIWASRKAQARNREDYTLNIMCGERSQKTWEWATELGLTLHGFHSRLYLHKIGKLDATRVFRKKT